MIPPIILFAILCCFFTLLVRVGISRSPFSVKNIWAQIIISEAVAAFVWVIVITQIWSELLTLESVPGDIICGLLIFLSTFWCHYWIGNFAGGFRVQMQINLAGQKEPIKIKEWMESFGGLGMDAFLHDRIQSILIPWNTVSANGGNLHLQEGWGVFFARLMKILKVVLPKVRN